MLNKAVINIPKRDSKDNVFKTEDLIALQSQPLSRKVSISQTKIYEWISKFDNQVYVSFSGGQDSTVLADMTARVCAANNWELVLVFCNTGLEHPKIVKFVPEFAEWLKQTYNLNVMLKTIRPKMSFKEVIEIHGYPVIGKDISSCVKYYREGSQWAINNFEGLDNKGNIHPYKQGMYTKWKFLVDAPFKISDACCGILKEEPFKKYEKETGRKPILGLMAYESKRRKNAYLRGGCNSFENNRPMSTPMGFWTKQDVLHYLKDFDIPYSEAYGDIIEEWTRYKRKENKPTGKLLTTGANRTGCQFCLFGIQQDGCPNRFQKMKNDDFKRYDYCMREENGLGIKKVLDYLGYESE